MKYLCTLLVSLLITALLSAQVQSQTWEMRGNLRGWVRGFTAEPNEIDLTQTRLKLELLSGFGEHAAFFSRLHLTHDSKMDDEITWDLKQAYIDYYTDWLTLRFGRQIIAWGKADEINPTDILNPQDLSNFLEDKIDRKIGLFTVKADWLFYGFELQTIWKPEYEMMKFADQDSHWGLMPSNARLMVVPNYSNLNLDQTDWAVKLSKSFGMYDFSLSYANALEFIPTPHYVPDTTGSASFLPADILRSDMIGLDFAGSIATVGLWGEAGYFITDDVDGDNALVKNPYVQFVLGSDYTFPHSIKINVQYFQEYITQIDNDYEEKSEEALFSKLGIMIPLKQAVTTRIGKAFGPGEAHAVEIFGIYDLKDEGYMVGPKLTLSPQDAVKFEFGAGIFGGKKAALFGRFKDNDVVYVKGIFSF